MKVPPQSPPEAQTCDTTSRYDWMVIRLALEYTLAWVIAYESNNFCQCRQPRHNDAELITELIMALGDRGVTHPVDGNGEFIVDSDEEDVDLHRVTAIAPTATVAAPPAAVLVFTVPANTGVLPAVPTATAPAATTPAVAVVIAPAGPAVPAVDAPVPIAPIVIAPPTLPLL
ncbi:hypothetical protein SCP_0602330 [Sparassis crispa]|uniref:Uncharacterized protein n=1 Tax=Sparassis crispa TaxID=139825 RepID=A0A401GPU6_9APHY|nr:hypothetical protein SCP_0602330 [Sparassis crispa]GBE84255.1 hypothetical protein SCP_0602330 [Sparassis crispa]